MPNQRYETLEGVLARIVDEDSRKRDLIADTRKMGLSDENPSTLLVDLDEGTETFELGDHALGQLSSDVGIPKRYFDRMHTDAPDLFRTNVHHWLYQEPDRKLVRGRRNDDGTVTGRAWLSDRYRRLDNIEIARTLLPEFEKLPTNVQFHNAAVTDSRFYLRAVFPDMQKAVKVGDDVQWGVEIRNSEVGQGLLSISGFVLRLVCTNGMVVSHELKARHVGRRLDGEGIFADETLQADDVAFWLAARDTLRAAISETRFEEIVSKLRETTEGEKIVRPIKASEALAQRYSLTEEEREDVLVSLFAANDFSQWGALNAITQTAQTRESFDRQAELESIGWDVANLSGREWATVAATA
ncbi:MAG: DUF932 domain-containing protein [Actinobacteria bacterium]|nr:DUF932 domain-containing protein [Actinomycetota bacterium]